VSSTPLNQSSSRSHAIFTITIEGKHVNSDTYFVSKLHLVDLAGSERISKSNVEGSTLTEAKHINLSLTYLEQVIIALHEKKLGNRTHIPYRNSLMTTILRDSLGGNCKTVMIANLSSDADNAEETISTSRFAMRCSLLSNEVEI
jgi:kinesin family protein 6/9